jgi:hypothetical protein
LGAVATYAVHGATLAFRSNDGIGAPKLKPYRAQAESDLHVKMIYGRSMIATTALLESNINIPITMLTGSPQKINFRR